MALTMIGPQNISTLKNLAETMFSDIKANSNYSRDNHNIANNSKKVFSNIFKFKDASSNEEKSSFGKLIRMRPVRDIRDLTLIFPVPSTRSMYRRDPCYLIGMYSCD